MAVTLPNGSVVSIASTYAAADTVTAITNASPGVVTAASHGISDGQFVEVTSGWSRLNGRIIRVDNGAADTFEIEGIDTTSTTLYPAGAGVGSVRDISAWTQISQVTNAQSQGGEAQFVTYAFLEDDTERQIPTNKSAQSLQLTIADDQTLAHYPVLDAADQDRVPRAIRVVLASGAVLVYNAYVSFNKTPTLTVNEIMVLTVSLSFSAPVTRYSS